MDMNSIWANILMMLGNSLNEYQAETVKNAVFCELGKYNDVS